MASRLFAAAALAAVVSGVVHASPISIGGTTFAGGLNDFPTSVVTISGGGNEFAGVTCEAALTGADIDTGCFNIASGGVFRLDFARTFANEAGADIYFTDSRFSADALDFSLDGTTFFNIAAGDFTNTGVNSTIRGVGGSFDLFAAEVDLSGYGFAPGGTYSSIWLRGAGESDPIVVGLLDGSAPPAIPLPASLPLLAVGLGGFALARRRV